MNARMYAGFFYFCYSCEFLFFFLILTLKKTCMSVVRVHDCVSTKAKHVI